METVSVAQQSSFCGILNFPSGDVTDAKNGAWKWRHLSSASTEMVDYWSKSTAAAINLVLFEAETAIQQSSFDRFMEFESGD